MSSATDTHGVTTPWRLFEGYQPLEGTYDEMLAAPGVLRPHCEGFVRSLEALGRLEFASRGEGARRSLRENGVTYNIYGDPQGVDRPWELDMVPLLISPADWTRLEPALVQRTRLLNLILADLYGPQTLLGTGLLPPSLVFSNPAFLRACHGIRVPHGIHLHLHAVDLARSPDGQWWVLADRTQAPSGAGYALENRIVLLRSLAETFRDCQVHRLASFFRAQRDTLIALAPHPHDQPRVVLLTPGPYNETYFEHAYLARYLGFTMVEGGDLTVRDGRVFIKTLEGLQPVDVIFRRLDDSFCDPLELRSDSSLGVAGLVEAARAGNVTIANALGSGVIETAAIMPFLPGLCRHLLGEDLMLPSVATWWGGQPEDLQYMLEHLDQLVAKRAFRTEARDPVFGKKLNDRERSLFAAELRARPDRFIAQEHVALSTAPVWHQHKMEPRPVVFRTYVAAAGDSYVVMPGGLTRVSAARDMAIVSMQRGGGSKDTWVLSEGPVSPVTLLAPAGSAMRPERAGSDLPSRVAESLFWLGRYVERAEHAIRLLRSAVARLTDLDTTDPHELSALLRVLVGLEMLPARFAEHVPLRELEEEMLSFIFRENPHAGLRQTLTKLRRIAAVVRDRLSIDTWRILNQLHQDLRLRHGRVQFDDVLAHLNRLINNFAAFSGMEMENMTRGHGWRFLDVGRRLERATNTTSLVGQALSDGPSDNAVLEPLLEVADSSMTYRRRYFARPQLSPVLDLLLLDDTNTRAVAFQLAVLSEHIRQLPRDPHAPSPTREERLIDQATATLRQVDPHTIRRGEEKERGTLKLTTALGSIESDLRALSETITYFYFSHAELRVS
jgi:uncharacterized circularly permuted ATP-grasp superfamily protein/uncharacterized alpha-E superfamily protein